MLAVLGLIDVVMIIANLLIMVFVGGYETFVSRPNLERLPGPAGMALSRKRRSAKGQASNRAYRHFINPSALEFHQNR